MITEKNLPESIREQIKEKHIDMELSIKILNSYNDGSLQQGKGNQTYSLPDGDEDFIMDMRNPRIRINMEDAKATLAEYSLPSGLLDTGVVHGGSVEFGSKELERIGIHLYPYVAYGVLNGGSSTSYLDTKKNKSFSKDLFDLYKPMFDTYKSHYDGLPKGLTPAVTSGDPDSSPTFIELKIRSLLFEMHRYKDVTGSWMETPIPFFQMTSPETHDAVTTYLDSIHESPYVKDLLNEHTRGTLEVLTEMQTMLTAYTAGTSGGKKYIFTNAYGKENEILALPGGHGQNFKVLRPIYEQLHTSGKRFAYLGNVDNIGFTIDPVELAVLAFKRKPAGFTMTWKSPVDVKGGILLKTAGREYTCADIGPAISHEKVSELEAEGRPVLFNSAIGLFDLDYFSGNIESIISSIPVRISEQKKDAGNYSQAEMITWEIIGMLDDFSVFGHEKKDRFLASKLVLENFITSGLMIDSPKLKQIKIHSLPANDIATLLHDGLISLMASKIGIIKKGDSWVPSSTKG